MIPNSLAFLYRRDFYNLVVNVLTGIFIARSLGPSSLGYWVAITLILSLGETFLRLRCDLASVYFAQNQKLPLNTIIGANYVSIFIASGIFAAIVTGGGEFILSDIFNLPPEDSIHKATALLLILMPLHLLSLSYAYICLAIEDYVGHSNVALVYDISYGVFAVTGLYFFDLGLVALVLSAILGRIVSFSVGFRKVHIVLGYTFKVTQGATLQIFRHSFGFYFTSAFGQLRTSFIRFIGGISLPPSDLAYIAQSQGLVALMGRFVDVLDTYFYPQLAGSVESNISKSAKIFRILIIFFGLLSTLGFFLAEDFVSLIYGEEFRESGRLLTLIIFPISLSFCFKIFVTLLNADGLSELVSHAQIFAFFVSVFGVVIFWDSINVSVLACIIGSSAVGYSGYVFFLINKRYRIGICDLSPKYNEFVEIFGLLKRRYT